MVNFSFPGFSTTDIFDDSPWIIQPKSKSTTIAVNPNMYDCLIREFNSRYGPPEDRGKQHGHIYRCWLSTDDEEAEVMDRVSITCYISTHTLSIQGRLHYKWTSTQLHEIGEKMNSLSLHLTSTPMSTSSHQVANATLQSLDFYPDVVTRGTQTDNTFTGTQTSGTQTSLTESAHVDTTTALSTPDSPEPVSTTDHVDTTSTLAFPDNSPEPAMCSTTDNVDSTTILGTDVSPKPVSTMCTDHVKVTTSLTTLVKHSMPEPATIDQTHVPTIPTSNMFSVLEIEDTPDDDRPPIPLPWIERKPPSVSKDSDSPRKSDNEPRSSPDCRTSPPPSAPANPPPATKRNFSQRETILIIGDSIPKKLVGRRMSRRYRVINRCIPGSTLDLWKKLAPVFVEEDNPTGIIIHCGTNNINYSLTSECISLLDSLATSVSQIAPTCTILMSSLTTQRHFGHSVWITEFNARLRDLCVIRKWTYICNANIRQAQLADDGLHLRTNGISTLARNYIAHIQTLDKDFCRSQTNQTVR